MNVTVYCSSTEGLPEKYYEAARTVAREAGAAGDTIVFGGIRRGMMRVLAEEAQSAGARVIGVIPSTRRDLAESTRADLNDENIYTTDVNTRKATMIDLADRFVVLPGGYGTLDELLSTFTVLTFERAADKPITVYNPDGLYTPLFDMLDDMRRRGLIIAALPPIDVIDY